MQDDIKWRLHTEQILLEVMSPSTYQTEYNIFQLSPETSPETSREGYWKPWPAILKWAGDHSPVCTPGGKRKLKGQCMSFKAPEGECKVAVWPPRRQNVVVPLHLNSTLNGKPNRSKMPLNQGQNPSFSVI